MLKRKVVVIVTYKISKSPSGAETEIEVDEAEESLAIAAPPVRGGIAGVIRQPLRACDLYLLSNVDRRVIDLGIPAGSYCATNRRDNYALTKPFQMVVSFLENLGFVELVPPGETPRHVKTIEEVLALGGGFKYTCKPRFSEDANLSIWIHLPDAAEQKKLQAIPGKDVEGNRWIPARYYVKHTAYHATAREIIDNYQIELEPQGKDINNWVWSVTSRVVENSVVKAKYFEPFIERVRETTSEERKQLVARNSHGRRSIMKPNTPPPIRSVLLARSVI
jgi:hypothetical protein